MSFIVQTSIEISIQDEPPHIQAPLRTKRVGAFGKIACCFSEEVGVGERSEATISVSTPFEGVKDIVYELHYRESEAKMIKAWMMVDYSKFVDLVVDNEVVSLDVEDHVGKEFSDIRCGVNWLRVDGWFKPVTDIYFGWKGEWHPGARNHRIEVLNPEDLSHFIVYRSRDRSRLEFAWVWRRGDVPEGTYVLKMRLS